MRSSSFRSLIFSLWMKDSISEVLSANNLLIEVFDLSNVANVALLYMKYECFCSKIRVTFVVPYPI